MVSVDTDVVLSPVVRVLDAAGVFSEKMLSGDSESIRLEEIVSVPKDGRVEIVLGVVNSDIKVEAGKIVVDTKGPLPVCLFTLLGVTTTKLSVCSVDTILFKMSNNLLIA